MDNITLALLAVLAVVTLIWFYNATLLTDDRQQRLDYLYKQLFSTDPKSYDEIGRLHIQIEEVNRMDVWAWQFCSALWLIVFIALIIYRIHK